MCERLLIRMGVHADDKDGRRGSHRPISRRVLRLTWLKCSAIGTDHMDMTTKPSPYAPFLSGLPTKGWATRHLSLNTHRGEEAAYRVRVYDLSSALMKRRRTELLQNKRLQTGAFQNIKSPRRQAGVVLQDSRQCMLLRRTMTSETGTEFRGYLRQIMRCAQRSPWREGQGLGEC